MQDLNGDLAAMAQQVQNGIAWIVKNAGTFGGNSREIYLSGHSSGSHLLAVALTQDWQAKYGIDSRVFKHALLISGLYDLHPVRLSARGKYVHLTDATEAQLSPQRHLDSLVCPLTIGYASLDTPEFQRQSRDFSAALNTAGKRTPVVFLMADAVKLEEYRKWNLATRSERNAYLRVAVVVRPTTAPSISIRVSPNFDIWARCSTEPK